MNVKLEYDVAFNAIIVNENKLIPNSYQIEINLITLTENNNYNNIAVQRILFLIKDILEGNIFCDIHNPLGNKLKKACKENHIIFFPEEPYDQIIGLLLFYKIHEILEGKMEIETLNIRSSISPSLKYVIDDFQSFEGTSEVEYHWWERADTTSTDNSKEMKTFPTWEEVGLGWEEPTELIPDVEFNKKINSKNTSSVIILDGGPEEPPTETNK